MQDMKAVRQALPLLVLVTIVAVACDKGTTSPAGPTIEARGTGHFGQHACIAPAARGYSRMVYDARSRQVFLFGGFSTFGFVMDILDVWAFDIDTKRWQLRARFDPLDYDALAFDTQSRKVIVLQPFAGPEVETWAYDVDNNTWEKLQPSPAQPPVRFGSRMAYDAESDRVVLFGGSDVNGEVLADTWAFDYESNAWVNLHPASGARPHHYHDMVYHEAGDRIVMFGGFEFVGGIYVPLGDTWAFDLNTNTWTELHPPAPPAPRAYAMLAYESRTEKIVMFGGILDETNWPNEPTIGETWLFDLDRVSWEQASFRKAASSRAWHQMVGIGNRVLLFGGGPSRFDYTNETYTYSSNRDRWTLVKSCGDHDD